MFGLRRFLVASASAVGFLGAGLLAAPAARGDIIVPDPPDTKRVSVEIRLDWGVFADRVTRTHVVGEGDTVIALARRLCGDAAHADAIVQANPELLKDPDHIAVGATLLIPPARALAPPPAADSPEARDPLLRWYDAFWVAPLNRRWLGVDTRAVPSDGAAAMGHPGVFLIAHDDAAALVARRKRGVVPLDDPAAAKGLVLSVGVNSLVKKSDPTVRIVVTYRLTGAEPPALTAETTIVRYDATGAVVDPPESGIDEPRLPGGDDGEFRILRDLPPPAGGGFRWRDRTAVLVAMLGLAAILGLALRRRRATPEQ